MFNSVRYFATVRRAMTIPLSLSIFTTSWSDNGLPVSSFLKMSAIMSFTLVLDTPSPLAVCSPAVKKKRISKMPCGVCIYLPETARLTVVSCDPATLARDLADLTAAGYRIEKATLVDLFPQTFHIETVVHLLR